MTKTNKSREIQEKERTVKEIGKKSEKKSVWKKIKNVSKRMARIAVPIHWRLTKSQRDLFKAVQEMGLSYKIEERVDQITWCPQISIQIIPYEDNDDHSVENNCPDVPIEINGDFVVEGDVPNVAQEEAVLDGVQEEAVVREEDNVLNLQSLRAYSPFSKEQTLNSVEDSVYGRDQHFEEINERTVEDFKAVIEERIDSKEFQRHTSEESVYGSDQSFEEMNERTVEDFKAVIEERIDSIEFQTSEESSVESKINSSDSETTGSVLLRFDDQIIEILGPISPDLSTDSGLIVKHISEFVSTVSDLIEVKNFVESVNSFQDLNPSETRIKELVDCNEESIKSNVEQNEGSISLESETQHFGNEPIGGHIVVTDIRTTLFVLALIVSSFVSTIVYKFW